MPTAQVVVAMDASSFAAAERRIMSGIHNMAEGFSHTIGHSAAIAYEGLELVKEGVIRATEGIVEGFKKSVEGAAEIEKLRVAFVPLVGSAEAARKKVEELEEIGTHAAFAIPGLVETGKILELFTHGALDTRKGIELIGDAAAVTGVDINALAMAVGRTFSNLQAGLPGGRGLTQLARLGVVTGDVIVQVNKLQKQGKGEEAWATLEKALGGYKGGLENLKNTSSGAFELLSQDILKVMRAFGAPINDAIRPLLQEAQTWVLKLEPAAKKLGDTVGTVMATMVNLFKNGKLGEVLGLSLELGAIKGFNALMRMLSEVAKVMRHFHEMLFTSDFWQGVTKALGMLAEAFVALGGYIAAALLNAFKGPIKWLQNMMQFIMEQAMGAWEDLKKELGFGGANAEQLENAKEQLSRAEDLRLEHPGEAADRAYQKALANATAMSTAVNGPRSLAEITEANKNLDAGLATTGGVMTAADFQAQSKQFVDALTQQLGLGKDTGTDSLLKQIFEGRIDEKETAKKLTDLISQFKRGAQPNDSILKVPQGAFAPGEEQQISHFKQGAVGSLRKLGGGGGIELTPFNSLLAESRKHTKLLEKIEKNTGGEDHTEEGETTLG